MPRRPARVHHRASVVPGHSRRDAGWSRSCTHELAKAALIHRTRGFAACAHVGVRTSSSRASNAHHGAPRALLVPESRPSVRTRAPPVVRYAVTRRCARTLRRRRAAVRTRGWRSFEGIARHAEHKAGDEDAVLAFAVHRPGQPHEGRADAGCRNAREPPGRSLPGPPRVSREGLVALGRHGRSQSVQPLSVPLAFSPRRGRAGPGPRRSDIARHLNPPVASVPPEDFGSLGPILAADQPASRRLTREDKNVASPATQVLSKCVDFPRLSAGSVQVSPKAGQVQTVGRGERFQLTGWR